MHHSCFFQKKFAWMDDSFDDDDNESSDPVDILPLHLDVAPKMEDANQNVCILGEIHLLFTFPHFLFHHYINLNVNCRK